LGHLEFGLFDADDGYLVPPWRWALAITGMAASAVGYVWLFIAWTVALKTKSLPWWQDIAAPTTLLVGGVSALALRQRGSAGGLALVASLVASLYLWPDPVRHLLAPAVVCTAGLLVSREVAALVALALSFLPQGSPGDAAALWLTAGSFWLASSYIYAALAQASRRQRRALALEQEVLKRREELRRLNDSLRNAYTLLERTNHELAAARDEAEEARRLKAQFAATISHELRTPLNLILGFAEVMYTAPECYEGAHFSTELRGDIGEIYRNTRHLLELVDDVLELSRIDQVRLAFTPEPTDVGALLREAAGAVAGLFRNRPVSLIIDLPEKLPACVADRARVRQVAINLLANAARFTDQGQVRLAARHSEATGEVIVTVADTGPGIPKEEQQRIFDPFYQVSNPIYRSRGGSGLGLAICKTFVQMHGGRIWVESEPGQGSAFHFSLPVRGAPPAVGGRAAPIPGAQDPFGHSVVLVGASEGLARQFRRGLPGLTVHLAHDAHELQEALEQWHPKAVVACAPDEGTDRIGQMLAQIGTPGLPVIQVRQRPQRALSQCAGVRAILQKPVGAEQLLAAIDNLGSVRSLLVVDDDPGVPRLIRRALLRAGRGIRVIAALNGEQALALLSQEAPDALVLDLAMPHMDGLTLLEALGQHGLAQVPVIVLTAMDLPGEQNQLGATSMEIRACGGLGDAEVLRYIEAIARMAKPRYLPASSAEPALEVELPRYG
jgi:signal transduction histidine kinase/CheY-like chemotaxis protein